MARYELDWTKYGKEGLGTGFGDVNGAQIAHGLKIDVAEAEKQTLQYFQHMKMLLEKRLHSLKLPYSSETTE